MRVAVIACLAVAGLSLLLPSAPTYDPFTWILWGREVLHLDLDTARISTWKPLPVLATTVFALFGGAAPALWLVTARAAGLLALVLAFRLARRLGGGSRVAGGVAVVALALSEDWLRFLAHGNSEIVLVALILLAVERHLDRAPGSALALGIAAGLLRPEAWPFLGLYAAWLWRAEPARRRAIAVGLLTIPVLWFVPEWLSSGDPFSGAGVATGSQEARRTAEAEFPTLEVLRRGAALVVLPVLVLAGVALGLALRRRDRVVAGLGLGALAWTAEVAVMQLLGYPGIGRFMVPAAGIVCVLAGVGVAWLMTLVPVRRAWRPALAALLLAASLPSSLARADRLGDQVEFARDRVAVLKRLEEVVARLGGPAAMLRLGQPCVNQDLRPALAWLLDVAGEDVCIGSPLPGHDPPRRRVIVEVPGSARTGPSPALPPVEPAPTLLLVDAGWRVLIGDPPRLLGPPHRPAPPPLSGPPPALGPPGAPAAPVAPQIGLERSAEPGAHAGPRGRAPS